MRRFSIAALVLALAVPAAAAAQAQDPIVVSALQFAQQGNHDTAINLLRSALTARPADPALKRALGDVLSMKLAVLSRQLAELRREISEIHGEQAAAAPSRPITVGVAGCTGNTPVRVGGIIGVPAKLVDAKPIYPPIAQSARIQGIVIIEATIDCQGNVTNPKVLRGQPLLDQAALDAVSQWRYSQTLHNGVPVPVIMTMTVTFRLE